MTTTDAAVVPRRPGRWGAVFALVWLVYLAQPIGTALGRTDGVDRWVTVGALVAFGIWFAVAVTRMRRWRIAGEDLAVRPVLAALAVGTAILALAAPGTGSDVVVGFVYLGVVAVMALPLRPALAVFAVLVAATLVLPALVPGWTSQTDFLPELVLACFAAFGVGQVLLRNAELTRAREQIVELAIGRERERLARDVHDILGHSLTVIAVKSELVGRLIEDGGPARARAEVADIEQLARTALADVRATVAGTREVSLAGELAAARRALDAAGIAAELPGSVEAVPPEHRELFAWTLREGVTNVLRHAAARTCTVRLAADVLEVVDDGRGAGAGEGGSGLRGLRARAEAAGAQLESGSLPGGGFRLRVAVP